MSGAAGASPRRLDVSDLLRPPRTGRVRRLPQLTLRALSLAWRAAPRDVANVAALQAIVGIGLAAQLLVGRQLLAGLVAGGAAATLSALAFELVALAGVSAIVACANLARAERQRLLAERVGRHCVDKVLEVACAVELIAFEHPEFSDRLQRAHVNAQIRPAQMTGGLLNVIGGAFAVAGIGVALLTIEPLLIVVVIAAAAPTALAAQRAGGLLHAFSVRQTERDRRRTYLFSVLSGRAEAAEVRSFSLAGFLRAQHDRLFEQRLTELEELHRRRMRLGIVGRLLSSGLTGGALVLLVSFVESGRMTVAAAGAAAIAMLLLATRLGVLVSGLSALHESSLFLEDFTTFVDALPAIDAAPAPATRCAGGATPAPEGFSRIDVEGVSFTYPSRREPSLRDVSMSIEAGEVVALVGANGSGKTTLAKLMAGLYVPDHGALRWDGVDVQRFDPERVRSAVAVILQDFARYHLSARDNIALGRHERHADLAAVQAAARATGAHELLSALPDGYETRLGPEFHGGTDMSVGQWQRVALARAFFRDAPFLILDEPTAALDPRAERELFDNVRTLFEDRSVLLISHRFANVRSADRIYVLDRGRVIEHGSHDHLMIAGGRYAELFRLQAKQYIDA